MSVTVTITVHYNTDIHFENMLFWVTENLLKIINLSTLKIYIYVVVIGAMRVTAEFVFSAPLCWNGFDKAKKTK